MLYAIQVTTSKMMIAFPPNCGIVTPHEAVQIPVAMLQNNSRASYNRRISKKNKTHDNNAVIASIFIITFQPKPVGLFSLMYAKISFAVL